MQRTKYFNQTRPSEVQLNWTETSRVNSILRRDRAYSQFGIRRGFQVSVNALDSTTIDIAPGEGYTGGQYLVNDFRGEYSGERISTLVDSATGVTYTGVTIEGQSLASYTNGVKNYVSLVYAEEESHALAERSYPYTTHTSVVTETYTVSVLTETDWNALSAEQLNKRILIAVVTANGAGVALTSSSIQQFVQPKTHPYISSFGAYAGIENRGLTDTTPVGSATLRWDASLQQFFYTAPGDTEGAGVTVTNNAVYTMYSGNTTYWLKLWVNQGLVSSIDITQTLQIKSLYGRQVPLACATDIALRDMTGSGTVSPTNPLGLSIDDLTGGGLDHQDLFHVNGISAEATSTQLQGYISAAPGVDRIDIYNLGGYSNSFLIDGVTYEEINSVSAGVNGQVSFDIVPPPDTGVYLIYLDNIANPDKVRIGNTLWSANIRVVDALNSTAGTGEITWDAAASTLTWESPADVGAGAGAGDTVTIIGPEPSLGTPEGYYKLYSANEIDWIIVYVSGALGASTSSNVTLTMTGASHSEEQILRICSVDWDEPTETLSLLEDLRSFFTADTRNQNLEEHDSDGHHTIPFRNQLKVAIPGNHGIYADVGTNYALIGHARSAYGLYATAPNSAAYCYANGDCAVSAIASRSVLFALGNTLGVKATVAEDTAGQFIADSTYGLKVVAGEEYGVSASAKYTAYYGTASVDYAGYFIAPNTAVYISAKTDSGLRVIADNDSAIYGHATNETGIFGVAEVATGIYGVAADTAIQGSAAAAIGVYGVANATGVVGFALNTGVLGTVNVNYGVFGEANNYAVYGTCSADGNIAVCGSHHHANDGTAGLFEASVGTGVYATVVSGYGLAAKGDTFGVTAYAADPGAGIYAVGVKGVAGNAADPESAIGVQGSLGIAASATAVYGVCLGSDATAVYGELANEGTGVYGSVNSGIGVIGYASASPGTGVKGSIRDGVDATGVIGHVSATGATAYYGRNLNVSGTCLVCEAGYLGGVFMATQAAATGLWVSASSLALDLRCPAVGAPSATQTHMPIKFNGVEYTIRLWT